MTDMELQPVSSFKGGPTTASENTTESKQSLATRFISSFGPHPKYRPRQKVSGDAGYDLEQANIALAETPLSRRLKGRHLQMIAIGGSIGTGLFVGSGNALKTGGPAALLIAFSLIGMMLYCVVHALGELAVVFPVAGSFSAYSTRFLDPAWGFAMGWNYAMQWLIVLPLEIVAAAITIDYWGSTVPKAVWVTIFWILIVVINLFGVKGYGEAEFVFSIIKVVAVVGFIILGIIINCGGGPRGSYIGGIYWRDPGALSNGFKGVCAVFVTAAFAFAGTELVGLAAAETANPRKSLPTAIKQVFWRITLFYIVSLLIIGLLVPYNNPRLGSSSSADAKASPFVISIENAGIKVLPDIMNVVIMIAVLSVGNSSVYGSSRTLAALAEQGQAPRLLSYIDRKGRPIIGIAISSSLGLLGYLSTSDKQSEAFSWMLAISGLSSIFTWGSICLVHIRFRRAWKLQGHTLDELAFTSQPGVFGSWLGFLLNILVLVMQFWVALFPLGGEPNANEFFSAYLAVPVVISFYIPYKILKKTKIVRAKDMDLVTGRREFNLEQLLAEERREQAEWPIWKKM
ncbi:amino acid permease/ SLC12A domain-containing protein [Kalaharituber pfeilii]|nr:amino acid permease/ SLC12A domain-containing protein [Kalaharituber pfeilii]